MGARKKLRADAMKAERKPARDNGQSLVPEPPQRITGTI